MAFGNSAILPRDRQGYLEMPPKRGKVQVAHQVAQKNGNEQHEQLGLGHEKRDFAGHVAQLAHVAQTGKKGKAQDRQPRPSRSPAV